MDTSSEAYRKACEVRWCLTQSQEQRSAYYQAVAEKRGMPSMLALKAAVMDEYRRRTQEPSLF